MKAICSAVLILIIASPPAIAVNQPSAAEMLKENLAAVLVVLKNQSLNHEAKKTAIIEIVNPMFDFDLMAKLTLGRRYWPDLSPDQRKHFTRLFIDRLRASYLERLTLYSDEKVQFEPAVTVKDKVHVPTNLVSKDDKISILYKLYNSDAGWKIYDLEIQGISIIRSYRAQFYEFLRTGSFDDLLAQLGQPAKN